MALALLTIMVMQCPRPFYVQAEEAPISMVGSSLRLGDGIEVSFFFHPGQSLIRHQISMPSRQRLRIRSTDQRGLMSVTGRVVLTGVL